MNQIYQSEMISERHRLRLQVLGQYVQNLKTRNDNQWTPKLRLVELIELENHPHFIACQYHPEFKSRPFSPHPLFEKFIKAAEKGK